jgi:hypothetical protein
MSRIGWRLTAGAAALALTAGTAQAATTTDRQAEAAGSPVTVTVDLAHPQGGLPADFVGLSYEMRELGVGNLDAGSGNLVALFRTLGPSNIRIAGNTLDRDTLWEPAGRPPPDPLPSWVADVVTPKDIARLGRFLAATGWRAEVGINVGHYDAGLAADEAHTLSATLGRRLVAAECGNEPNSFASKGLRTAPYGYAQYKPDWEACATAAGRTRLAGPDTSSPALTGPWVAQFAQDERPRLTLLTAHAYSVSATASIATLLSPQTDAAEMGSVATELAAARATGLPIRLDETNSAAGGGVAGVSDSYASALWSLDYSLLMAQDGFNGLNFHGGLGVCGAPLYNGKFQLYTPICAANTADEQAKVYTAAPEFYGLAMAGRMGTGRFLPVTVSGGRNVTAYAVRGSDGRLNVAVIEKDDTSLGPVSLSVNLGGRCSGTARVVHLTGASLAGAQGIAIQGATVDRAGHLARPAGDPVRLDHGDLNLRLAAGSAEVITLAPRSAGCAGG